MSKLDGNLLNVAMKSSMKLGFHEINFIQMIQRFSNLNFKMISFFRSLVVQLTVLDNNYIDY